jgi:hypothetical protein
MIPKFLVPGLAAAGWCGVLAGAAAATPAGPISSVAPSPVVVKVYGCHRSCEFGAALGWHRHGLACRPIACVPLSPTPGRCWVDWRGVRHCRW